MKKDVWPYLFRHTTLTRMAKILTEAQLEKFAGWIHGSRMTARYVHFSARDVEDAILSIYGIKRDREESIAIRTVRCRRCGAINPETNTFCSNCGLNFKQSDQALREEGDMEDLVRELEGIKMLIARLEAEIERRRSRSKSPTKPHLLRY